MRRHGDAWQARPLERAAWGEPRYEALGTACTTG
jgi:hypothetical protein